MLSLLLHFFPTFFPQATTAFSYNEKWHIVKVLCFPTSSHTHSELGAKCSWCAASWTSLSAAKLAPSHACTPGMHSHSTGFLWATSYVAGPLFLSSTGPSNYKSNYLHKLSLQPRGRNSIYQNMPLSGENGKTQTICVTVLYFSWKLDVFETAASLLCSLFCMAWDEVSLYFHFLSTWGLYGDLISSPHVNQAKPDCLPRNMLRKYFVPLQLLASFCLAAVHIF